jgi:hypothetical protein
MYFELINQKCLGIYDLSLSTGFSYSVISGQERWGLLLLISKKAHPSMERIHQLSPKENDSGPYL